MKARRQPVPWYESPWQIAARAIGIAVTIVLVVAAGALFAYPRFVGGASLTVLSGSMEPTFHPGDVIVVRGIEPDDVCKKVAVNDIITYFPEPNSPDLITHRVVSKSVGSYDDGSSCRLLPQGDANSTADVVVSPQQVRGVFMYGVPKIGWARDWIAHNTMTAAIALGVLVFGAWIWGGIRGPKTRIIQTSAGVPIPAGVPVPAAAEAMVQAPPLVSDVMPAGSGITTPPAPMHNVSPPPPPPPVPPPPTAATADYDLRLRELELRERELNLREREFAFAQQVTQPAKPTTAPEAPPPPGGVM
ncbi:MAG: signal peptidase I [Cellulomonadaceae bacterium]|jgi:signal peptidase|nr:signal peptidase I [Cellulomonadaceae bacterium]